MSWFSTSVLKSERWPHSSPAASGTVVIWRSFGMSWRNCSSRVGILDEVRFVLFDEAAAAQRVGVVEALVEVDAPVAVRADAFADFLAGGRDEPHAFVRVVDVVDNRAAARVGAERAIAGFHHRARPVAQRESGARNAARRIALAVVADGAAEHLVHGHAERFALDVPEREVERAHGVDLLVARRIEPGHVHLLPDGFDAERILADERRRRLLEHVLRCRPRRCR